MDAILKVVTKTDNDYKRPQPTRNNHRTLSNEHKPQTNDYKLPANEH